VRNGSDRFARKKSDGKYRSGLDRENSSSRNEEYWMSFANCKCGPNAVKKFAFSLILIFLLPAITAISIFVVGLVKIGSLADFRMALVHVYSVAPATVVRLDIREALNHRDFKRALRALKRQRMIAESIGPTFFMKHDLIESTNKVVALARLTGDEEVFADWVQDLRKMSPTDYLALSLQSQVAGSHDVEIAMDAAKQAIGVLPVNETPYRAMALGDLRQGEGKEVENICRQFSSAQLGAFEPWYDPTAGISGQGLRTLSLAFEGNGSPPKFSISHGMKLAEPVSNVFDVDSEVPSPLMRFIVPSVPGLKLTLNEIVFHTGSGVRRFSARDLRVVPTFGYALSAVEFLITSANGEALIIRPATGDFPAASQVEVGYQMDRLALANDPACLKNIQ
jgi:hypothetical protein